MGLPEMEDDAVGVDDPRSPLVTEDGEPDDRDVSRCEAKGGQLWSVAEGSDDATRVT